MIMSTDMRNTMIGQIANQMNEIVQAYQVTKRHSRECKIAMACFMLRHGGKNPMYFID